MKEDNFGKCHIENITEYSIRTFEEFRFWLSRGSGNKLKRKTIFNNTSSRSHTILELALTKDPAAAVTTNRITPDSVFTFCDLAGSERFSDDQLTNKSHKQETKNINVSLSHLGR